MGILLLGPGQSRAFRTLWMLEEVAAVCDIEFEHQIKGYPTEEETELLVSLNPMGQFPVIQDDGFVLRESMAINHYLASKYDVLQPQSLESQALAWQWAFWAMTAVETPALNALKYTFGMMGFEKDSEKVKEQGAVLERPLRVLDDALGGAEFLLDDEFCVADLNVASVIMWVTMADLDVGDYANVTNWFQRCMSREAAQKLQPTD